MTGIYQLCSVDGCTVPKSARGYCKLHYARWYRHGDPLGGGTLPSRETIGARMYRHGHATGRKMSLTYRSWCSMLTRCTNPNFPTYWRYGGRGIKVCDRWRIFENFLADMGERSSAKYSIDRYPDRHGNYEPGNCRWATMKEQCRNRETTRAVIRSDGKRFNSMVEAAEAINGNRRCIRDVCTGRQKAHKGFRWEFA